MCRVIEGGVSLNNSQINKSPGSIYNENTESGFGHQSSAQILVPLAPDNVIWRNQMASLRLGDLLLRKGYPPSQFIGSSVGPGLDA